MVTKTNQKHDKNAKEQKEELKSMPIVQLVDLAKSNMESIEVNIGALLNKGNDSAGRQGRKRLQLLAFIVKLLREKIQVERGEIKKRRSKSAKCKK